MLNESYRVSFSQAFSIIHIFLDPPHLRPQFIHLPHCPREHPADPLVSRGDPTSYLIRGTIEYTRNIHRSSGHMSRQGPDTQSFFGVDPTLSTGSLSSPLVVLRTCLRALTAVLLTSALPPPSVPVWLLSCTGTRRPRRGVLLAVAVLVRVAPTCLGSIRTRWKVFVVRPSVGLAVFISRIWARFVPEWLGSRSS